MHVDRETLVVLIDSGANIHTKHNDGSTPLHELCAGGKNDMALVGWIFMRRTLSAAPHFILHAHSTKRGRPQCWSIAGRTFMPRIGIDKHRSKYVHQNGRVNFANACTSQRTGVW